LKVSLSVGENARYFYLIFRGCPLSVLLRQKFYNHETHMIDFKRKHVINIIFNYARFHQTIKLKIIY
ncbi:MAG TPA: hypothetical protein DCY25_05705, partial [Bacteroidales bacterium]|nr:hypothetical protein [Bacteroidales bacterium]